MTNKHYMLVSFTRDLERLSKGKIHLIGSNISVSEFNIGNLKSLEEKTLIIRIKNFSPSNLEAANYYEEIKHSEYLTESIFTFFYFFNQIKADGESQESSIFMKSLILGGDLYEESPKLSDVFKNNNLKNILFVFEDINWDYLKYTLNLLNISISGGTISRRQYLTTTQYQLSKYILYLGYSYQEIYASYRVQSGIDNAGMVAFLNLAKDFYIKGLTNKINEQIVNIHNIMKIKERKLLGKQSGIDDLMNILNKDKKSNKGLVLQIEKDKRSLERAKIEISKYQSEIDKNKQLISNLPNIEVSTLKGMFYNDIYMPKLWWDSKNFDSTVKNLKQKVIKNKYNNFGYRPYSTLCRFNNINTMSNNKNIFNRSKIIKTNIRYISLFSDNNIITENLLKLLYSKNKKEVIQEQIEEYLLSEQNQKFMDYISKTSIEYKLLNPDILKIFLDLEKKITKLHRNYITPVPFHEGINKQILSKIEVKFIINIILGRLLLIISNNNIYNNCTSATEVTFNIGKEIINRYNYNLYLEHSLVYNSFSKFLAENKNITMLVEDPTKLVEVGSILIGWLIELKLIKKKVIIYGKTDKKNILVPGDNLTNHISNSTNYILNLPVKLPMICKPKKYLNADGSIVLGGFLSNDKLYVEPLFIEKSNLAEKSELSNKNIIYQMIDNINSVAFSINQEVLDFITKNFKTYDLIIDPKYKHPLENKLKLTSLERKELESFKSKQNLETEILNIANIFRNIPEIYIPVRLDYRGRLYCNVEYFHYQGIELAKSLLNFAKGEKVYLKDKLSLSFLKIFGANCYGNDLDKKSFMDRIDWIDENNEDILKFENGILLSKAENKLLFIAFCFEYKKYINALENNEEYFITKLPIQLDASCNGFQHLSLLLEDTTLAKNVNLASSTWNDKPDDFYTFLSLKIKEFLELELLNNKYLEDKLRDSYLRICNLNFQKHRTLVKKTIMTIPYNSTTYTNILDMKEEFTLQKINNEHIYIHKKNKDIIFKEIDFKVICRTIYICLYRDFPRLEVLLKYFKDIANISNKLGIVVPWILPSGLTVKQKYFGSKKIKYKPFIYSNDLFVLNILDKESLNTRKQIRSLMPNLVHSLDAASLALLIDHFFKEGTDMNFYSVHDCFAVTCNNVNLICELLKLSYYKIYCEDSFLINFDSNFKESIIKQFGSECFSLKTNTINLINAEGEKISLNYPDVTKITEPNNLNFMGSSYFIN